MAATRSSLAAGPALTRSLRRAATRSSRAARPGCHEKFTGGPAWP